MLKTARSAQSKETQTAITLLLMSAVHTSIYVMETLSWESIYVNNLFGYMSPNVLIVVQAIGQISDTASLIVRFWNFWIYMIMVCWRCRVTIISGIGLEPQRRSFSFTLTWVAKKCMILYIMKNKSQFLLWS